MYSGQHRTSKNSSNSSEKPAPSQFAPRPFVIQPKTQEVTPQQDQTPEEHTQKEEAQQYQSAFIDISKLTRRTPGAVTPRVQMKLNLTQQEDMYGQEAVPSNPVAIQPKANTDLSPEQNTTLEPFEKVEEVANEAIETQQLSESGASGDEDANSNNGGTTQPFGAESQSKLKEDKSKSQISPPSAEQDLDQMQSVQTKLVVGTPGDKYEQKADASTAHELTHTIQQTDGVQLPPQPEKDNKQPKLSQKYPHTTGIQPQIQQKTDPGQILEQLKNIPPSNAATAYDTAQANSATAWSEQKQALEESIPRIPAPTGLPAKNSLVKQTPQTASKADTNKEPLLPGVNKAPVAPNPPSQSDATVQIAPPLPITPTHIAGGNTAPSRETADPQIAASAQNALNSVNLDSNQISTQAGTVPTVNLTDAAINPAQLDNEQQQANQQVQQEKAKAAQDINQDYGENDIFPQSSDEIIKANKQLTLAQVPGAKERKHQQFPQKLPLTWINL